MVRPEKPRIGGHIGSVRVKDQPAINLSLKRLNWVRPAGFYRKPLKKPGTGRCWCCLLRDGYGQGGIYHAKVGIPRDPPHG